MMMPLQPYPNFISGSYPSLSPIADCERTINWYPEAMESRGATSPMVLYPTPGQQTFLTVGTTSGRALFSMDNHTTGVVGDTFYELTAGGTSTTRGTVAASSQLATITYNGAGGGEQFITSGGNGYIWDVTSNAFTQVLTGTATMGAMLDGYFLAFDTNTSKLAISNLLDGLTWDPSQFAQRSIAPDPWRAMLVSNREIWLIGEQTGEVWYDAGSFPFPLAPVPGAFYPYGIIAPFSAATVGQSVMWLTGTADGAGQIVRARGYTPEVVSTRAVEQHIRRYARDVGISDAEALVYQTMGHLLYVLRFPAANATWVWDDGLGLWHEVGTWNPTLNRYDVWSPRVHCFAFNKHLVGHAQTGTIAELGTRFGTEADGKVIRRVRVAPGVTANDRRLFNARFQLQLEPGLGVASGQGSDPQVMLRTSKDGGKTWSHERHCGAGKMGEYHKRVFWTRNGSGKTDGVEVSVSDPIPWRILNAWVGLAA
jgi:hypothetical protein